MFWDTGLYSEKLFRNQKLLFVRGKEHSLKTLSVLGRGHTKVQAVSLFYGKCCHKHGMLHPFRNGAPGDRPTRKNKEGFQENRFSMSLKRFI